jgi:hypothetical protein
MLGKLNISVFLSMLSDSPGFGRLRRVKEPVYFGAERDYNRTLKEGRHEKL